MSIPFRLLLPVQIRDEMFAHAQAELPNECCGQLAGKVGDDGVARVTRRYPLVNQIASPKKFHAAGSDLFDAARDMRKNGLELLAIYHSHPTSDPIPSATDLQQSFYGPGIVNFIISLKQTPPEIRGWFYAEAEFELTSDNLPYV